MFITLHFTRSLLEKGNMKNQRHDVRVAAAGAGVLRDDAY